MTDTQVIAASTGIGKFYDKVVAQGRASGPSLAHRDFPPPSLLLAAANWPQISSLLRCALATREGGKAIRVLELCCGAGAVSVWLAQTYGCHVTGVDLGGTGIVAAQALAAERGVAHLTCFVCGDAMRFADMDRQEKRGPSFDVVVSFDGFCHIPDRQALLSLVSRRWLVEGGTFVLIDHTAEQGGTAERLHADMARFCRAYGFSHPLHSLGRYCSDMERCGLRVALASDSRADILRFYSSLVENSTSANPKAASGQKDPLALMREAVRMIEGGAMSQAQFIAHKVSAPGCLSKL